MLWRSLVPNVSPPEEQQVETNGPKKLVLKKSTVPLGHTQILGYVCDLRFCV